MMELIIFLFAGAFLGAIPTWFITKHFYVLSIKAYGNLHAIEVPEEIEKEAKKKLTQKEIVDVLRIIAEGYSKSLDNYKTTLGERISQGYSPTRNRLISRILHDVVEQDIKRNKEMKQLIEKMKNKKVSQE